METTKDRVWARINAIKKPQRKKVVRVEPTKENKRINKYATMLYKLEEHFGSSTIPDLLDFVANRKDNSKRK